MLEEEESRSVWARYRGDNSASHNLYLQETPVQVLKLPTGPETSDLEDKSTIVVQEVIYLIQKGRVSSNTDVLLRAKIPKAQRGSR